MEFTVAVAPIVPEVASYLSLFNWVYESFRLFVEQKLNFKLLLLLHHNGLTTIKVQNKAKLGGRLGVRVRQPGIQPGEECCLCLERKEKELKE